MFCLFVDTKPIDFDEASISEKLRKAMNEKIGAIKKNDTWELTTLQLGKKPIGVKWVYKVKKNSKGKVKRYKSRLFVKGYKQRAGIDYDEVFAPIVRLETIRLLISLVSLNKWKIHQMDMKSAFLNGFLDEEVYIEQPEGYVVQGHEDKVLRLKKALYGLKQALRIFDDFKKEMAKEFEMTVIGLMSYYLGIEVQRRDDGIFISQEAYAKEVSKRFTMENYNSISIPIEVEKKLSRHIKEGPIDQTLFRSLAGSLSRYVENPITYHFKVAKRILRYLKGGRPRRDRVGG
ncbi:hypothetical protein RJ639_028730 [Escallonia herrerae]|uniref:Reverse transcriptase Ty1/copia-type domain-containing protein n=1 Tax=Escallonia herrerae TaxID=1293975 RepID=A0AA89BEM3_9ASTE|nr:hypothetical protein RJ639_028730 [Escallonia herrerae]